MAQFGSFTRRQSAGTVDDRDRLNQGCSIRLEPMTKTYTQIVKQIETLQLQAEKLRRNEIADVVARIREAISFYKLTAADLGLGAGKASGGTAAPAKRRARKGGKATGKRASRSGAAVKYSNGAGGTWVGLGKRPQWLRDALAAGKTLADFAVK